MTTGSVSNPLSLIIYDNNQEVELLLLHSTAKIDQVKRTLSPPLSGLQNGLYSKMADVAVAAAHLQRVY